MTFQDARKRYIELRGQLRAGQLDLDQFSEQVQQLRLQDAAGNWWTISSENGGWLRWDGGNWVPGQPPAEEMAPVAGPESTQAINCPKCQSPVKPGRKFCGRCGGPVFQTAEPAAAPPSSPTVCPQCSAPLKPGKGFCTACGATAAATGVPPAGTTAEIVIPAPKPEGGRSRSGGGFAKFGRATWNIISLGGCTVISGLWYWYSGMAETKPDYKTCAAIILLPLLTIVLRSQIDRLLRPLQSVFGGMPRLVRLGIGLAIPFVLANYLYAAGYSQFDYLFKTVVLSTVLSYVLLRVPSPVRTLAGRAARRAL